MLLCCINSSVAVVSIVETRVLNDCCVYLSVSIPFDVGSVGIELAGCPVLYSQESPSGDLEPWP
jgi:hypothetical protein